MQFQEFIFLITWPFSTAASCICDGHACSLQQPCACQKLVRIAMPQKISDHDDRWLSRKLQFHKKLLPASNMIPIKLNSTLFSGTRGQWCYSNCQNFITYLSKQRGAQNGEWRSETRLNCRRTADDLPKLTSVRHEGWRGCDTGRGVVGVNWRVALGVALYPWVSRV